MPQKRYQLPTQRNRDDGEKLNKRKDPPPPPLTRDERYEARQARALAAEEAKRCEAEAAMLDAANSLLRVGDELGGDSIPLLENLQPENTFDPPEVRTNDGTDMNLDPLLANQPPENNLQPPTAPTVDGTVTVMNLNQLLANRPPEDKTDDEMEGQSIALLSFKASGLNKP